MVLSSSLKCNILEAPSARAVSDMRPLRCHVLLTFHPLAWSVQSDLLRLARAFMKAASARIEKNLRIVQLNGRCVYSC